MTLLILAQGEDMQFGASELQESWMESRSLSVRQEQAAEVLDNSGNLLS